MRLKLTQALVSSFVAAALTAAAPQPVVQTTGVAVSIAKRSGVVNADKSVNIEELNSHVVSIKAKILRGFSNFEKNTGFPHPSALKETQKRATGADPLTDSNNVLWYGTISVGDPSHSFTSEVSCTVDESTTYPFWQWTSIQAPGMSLQSDGYNLYLPGPKCGLGCAGHTIYNPSSSSSAQDLDMPFSDSYGDGSYILGELYADTVAIAGLTAKKQVFGVASYGSSGNQIDEFPPDGLMGMAFPQIGYTQSPVFQSLVTQGQTNEPAFSFKLAASGAELYLGGANSKLYTGDFSYAPVTHKAFWEVKLDNIKGNGQTIMSNIDCIVDTGTTPIVGIPSQVARLHKALGGTDASRTVGAGFYTFPCGSFPKISLTFGGTSFPISADTLNLGRVFEGSSDCISGIVGGDTSSGFWIVGDVFLQNVYTTFDVGQSRVGFARLA